MRKPVFGDSAKASFKPVSSATETSYKFEILPVARLNMLLSKKQIIKALIHIARMRRLVCAFVVRTPQKTGFLASRPI